MTSPPLAPIAAWTLLVGATIGGAFTLNAFAPIRPSRWSQVPRSLVSMFAAELAAYHLLWQATVTAGLVGLGALDTWPGQLGLGLAAGSWCGLLVLVAQGRRAQLPIRAALATLGDHLTPLSIPWWRLLNPFPVRLARTRILRNIEYARVAGRRLRLDVHLPADRSAPRPAIVQIHGGAWVLGDKREQGVPLLTRLSDRGFVGFNVNYRLSPGATFPDHLVDIKRAIAWVREHADEYGVDPSFIAITGGSAGAHLAAMAALTAGEPRFQPGFEASDTRVQAAIPLYGIYDLTDASKRHAPGFLDTLLEPLVMKAFIAEAPERFADASPITHVHADAPPFFVIHGDRDTMAPLADAREFVAALREVSRAPVLFAEIGGGQHAFDVFLSPRSLPVIEGVGAFLDHLWRLRPARPATAQPLRGPGAVAPVMLGPR